MPVLDQAAKELEAELDALDKATDRLRAAYEQYFQGIERQPPSFELDKIKRKVRKLHTTAVRNTELRFRINQLVAKFSSYNNYWNRICRQIEEGTYRRDVFKARYRSQRRHGQEQAEKEQRQAEEPSRPPPAAGRAPRSAAGLTDDHVNAIYDAYVMAKRRCREDVRGLTREALADSLRKQIPTIRKRYKCSTVEFKVVIKGGRAILKAVPKY